MYVLMHLCTRVFALGIMSFATPTCNPSIARMDKVSKSILTKAKREGSRQVTWASCVSAMLKWQLVSHEISR